MRRPDAMNRLVNGVVGNVGEENEEHGKVIVLRTHCCDNEPLAPRHDAQFPSLIRA